MFSEYLCTAKMDQEILWKPIPRENSRTNEDMSRHFCLRATNASCLELKLSSNVLYTSE